jgi:hypothetical protein
MSEELSKRIEWNSRLEEYFASTGEKAICYAWIHKHSEAMYSKRTTWIDLPVIVLSGVLGFLSVGSTNMFAGNETVATSAIGAGSLAVSVLNTIGSYFGWAKRAEGHRIANIQYSKLYRFLTIELSLPRHERMTPYELLKYTREAVDRLQEISPLMPPEIVAMFKSRFGDEKYKDISKPEETNGLEKIVIFEEVEQPLELSLQSPRVDALRIRLPSLQRSSQLQPESRSTEAIGASIYHELHSQPNDLPSQSLTVPPQASEASAPSSQ